VEKLSRSDRSNLKNIQDPRLGLRLVIFVILSLDWIKCSKWQDDSQERNQNQSQKKERTQKSKINKKKKSQRLDIRSD